jgi:broad specificity phosphatase PhoE
MTIGMIRHFKVNYKPKAKWMNSKQFNEWVETYNNSEIIQPSNINYIGNWDICFSSDLKRSVLTAKLIYNGIIIRTNDLREIGINIFKNNGIKLHYNIWLIINRIVWYFSQNSHEETRHETILRAKKFIDFIETNNYSKILVVSHGAFMKYLNKELKQRGYKGKMGLIPENGKLIIYSL